MAEGKVVEGLMGFGLTRDEAEAYVFILRAGPCTASAIARKLGINRMRTYRTLKKLQEKEMVEDTLTRPAEFAALPLEGIVGEHMKKQRETVLNLEKSREEIIEHYKDLQRIENVHDRPRFRMIRGRQQTYDTLASMYGRANSRICLETTLSDLVRLRLASIGDGFGDLKKKSIQIQIVTNVDPSEIEAIKDYLESAEIRHANARIDGRLCIVDSREVLVTFVYDDSADVAGQTDLGVWTNSMDHADRIGDYFASVWRNAIPSEEFLSRHSRERMLSAGLDLTKKILEASGWVVQVPGKLVGESGIQHSFSLTAMPAKASATSLVLDLRGDDPSNSIFCLNSKAVDVKSTLRVLVGSEPWDETAEGLARRYCVELVQASDERELAERLVKEANRILTR